MSPPNCTARVASRCVVTMPGTVHIKNALKGSVEAAHTKRHPGPALAATMASPGVLTCPKIRNAGTQYSALSSASGTRHLVVDIHRFGPHRWVTSTCSASIPRIMRMPQLADSSARIYRDSVLKPPVMFSYSRSNLTQSPISSHVGLDDSHDDTVLEAIR